MSGPVMFLRALIPVLLLAGCSQNPAAPSAMPPLAGAAIGGPFTLIDQQGRTVTDRSFAGRYRIMYFGYTFCPDVCPTDVQHIAAAMKLLGAQAPDLAARVVPVFVTVDPRRDTPAVLRQFTAAFDSRLVGLTGSDDAIARLAKAYGVYHQAGKVSAGGGYVVDHSRQSFLMAPDGKPLALLPQEQSPQAIVDELRRWAS